MLHSWSSPVLAIFLVSFLLSLPSRSARGVTTYQRNDRIQLFSKKVTSLGGPSFDPCSIPLFPLCDKKLDIQISIFSAFFRFVFDSIGGDNNCQSSPYHLEFLKDVACEFVSPNDYLVAGKKSRESLQFLELLLRGESFVQMRTNETPVTQVRTDSMYDCHYSFPHEFPLSKFSWEVFRGSRESYSSYREDGWNLGCLSRSSSPESSVYLNNHLSFLVWYESLDEEKGSIVGIEVIPTSVRHGSSGGCLSDTSRRFLLDPKKTEFSSLNFSYSVTWMKENGQSGLREEHRNKESVRFYSLVNSLICLGCLCLMFLVAVYRLLKRLPEQKTDEEGPESDEIEERKMLEVARKEVDRLPSIHLLFFSFVGLGLHLVIAVLVLIGLCLLVQGFSEIRFFSLALALVIAAFPSGALSMILYQFARGKSPILGVLVAPVASGPLLVGFGAIYSMTRVQQSLRLHVFVHLLCAIVFVLQFVVSVAGGLVGYCVWPNSPEAGVEVPTSQIRPRKIQKKWYLRVPVLMLFCTHIPFGSLYVELYFLASSISGSQPIHYSGTLIVQMIFSLTQASLLSILITHISLTKGDFRWWWRSWAVGGSFAVDFFFWMIFSFFYRSSLRRTLGYGLPTFLWSVSQTFSFVIFLSVTAFSIYGALGFVGAFVYVQAVSRCKWKKKEKAVT